MGEEEKDGRNAKPECPDGEKWENRYLTVSQPTPLGCHGNKLFGGARFTTQYTKHLVISRAGYGSVPDISAISTIAHANLVNLS